MELASTTARLVAEHFACYLPTCIVRKLVRVGDEIEHFVQKPLSGRLRRKLLVLRARTYW
jgi:hypothetical protein